MKFLILISGLLFSQAAYNQNCNFYYLQEGKTIEMTFKNKKGKETGRQVYSISNVTKSGTTTTSTIHSEFFSDKGKSTTKAVNNIKCSQGVLMMDMKLFIPAAQQEQMGEATAKAGNVYLEYPTDMKEGDMLKDSEFNMDYKMNGGIAASVAVSITERKVVGKETITTPAGNWDCFKITSKNKITTKVVVAIPIRAEVTEWYAPGFGVVKSDANGATTEITSIK